MLLINAVNVNVEKSTFDLFLQYLGVITALSNIVLLFIYYRLFRDARKDRYRNTIGKNYEKLLKNYSSTISEYVVLFDHYIENLSFPSNPSSSEFRSPYKAGAKLKKTFPLRDIYFDRRRRDQLQKIQLNFDHLQYNYFELYLKSRQFYEKFQKDKPNSGLNYSFSNYFEIGGDSNRMDQINKINDICQKISELHYAILDQLHDFSAYVRRKIG
jgi:Zn-dependent oligopeptidase